MAARPQFEVVEETEPLSSPPRTSSAEGGRAAGLLLLALKALSQRTVVALADLFCLLTIGSVFTLWFVSPAEPTINQIVKLSIYGVIVLAANWIVRSRR